MKAPSRFAIPAVLPIALLILVAAFDFVGGSSGAELPRPETTQDAASSNGAIGPQNMADSLHFVIAADRATYCRSYLASAAAGRQSKSPPGERTKEWPLPFDVFRLASESVQSNGAEFSYALRSLLPIDPRNGPQTNLERKGLVYVRDHAGRTYYGYELLGGRRYLTAVYPDLPAAPTCVACHNRHGSHWNPGDVIGGVVIRIPLEF